MTTVTAETSQMLCQRCAMCCDGTIFSRVPLEPSEVAPVQKMGLRVFQLENKAHFAQPCVKLHDASCSIYAERPATCRRYRCRVLRRLEAGEMTAEQAHALVGKATTLASTLRDLLASVGDATRSIWKRLEELAQSENLQLESVEFSTRHARLGMHAMMLRHVIDTEFRTSQLKAMSARMDDLSVK